MNDPLGTILAEWKERKLPEPVARDVDITRDLGLNPSKIVAVTGFRRVGKTWLVLHAVRHLLERFSRTDVVYINFEDERIPQRAGFLSELLPAIKQAYGRLPKYLFLDELHVMPDWSRWLRRVYDTEDIRLCVTGSSSKVSSHELPTELRGRALERTLHPLSYREYLRFSGDELPSSSSLAGYLAYGGMPEVVLMPAERKLDVLQEYLRTLIRRDIAERYRIKNEESLSAVVRLLLNSTYFSISKTYHSLKSMQYEVGKSTVQRYLEYLEDAYFLRSLFVLSPKVKHQMQTSRKVYVVDNGFIAAGSVAFSRNTARLLENAVLMELVRRLGPDDRVNFWRNYNGKEVDFVVRRSDLLKELIQSCAEVSNPETLARELSGLKAAAKELGGEAGMTVVTMDEEGERKVAGRVVRMVPAWKWLMSG